MIAEVKKIKNAIVYTMSCEPIKNGIVIYDDKIRYVGEDTPEFDVGEVIDAGGKCLFPGLIDAHSHLGMFEDSLGFEGDDGNEESDPVTPQMRAIDAVNPQDRGFSDAVRAGVTTVLTGPGSANPISGQFAAMKTRGVCVDDMVIKAPAAMKFSLGENPKSVYHSKGQMPVTRMGVMALIRETLYKAKEYMRDWEEYRHDPEEADKPEFDIKLEALIPVLKKEIPVKIHAHRADDICSAIRIKKEFDLWVTVEHCTDGSTVADILKKEEIPVMLGPTLCDRSKPELKSSSFATYKKLSETGLSVAIITDHPEITIENLPLCAAMAAANGMKKKYALTGITINAARNCGIDDRVGSIEVGKDADFVLFDKPPCEFGAKVLMTVIDGETVYKA